MMSTAVWSRSMVLRSAMRLLLPARLLGVFPCSPEMRMVVPAHQLPFPLIVLTHAEGCVVQDQKTMDVIEPLRTDLLPRQHVAYEHTQEGPVRDDEHGPLLTRHKMVQGF